MKVLNYRYVSRDNKMKTQEIMTEYNQYNVQFPMLIYFPFLPLDFGLFDGPGTSEDIPIFFAISSSFAFIWASTLILSYNKNAFIELTNFEKRSCSQDKTNSQLSHLLNQVLVPIRLHCYTSLRIFLGTKTTWQSYNDDLLYKPSVSLFLTLIVLTRYQSQGSANDQTRHV